MKIYEIEWFVLIKPKFRGGRHFFTYKVLFSFLFHLFKMFLTLSFLMICYIYRLGDVLEVSACLYKRLFPKCLGYFSEKRPQWSLRKTSVF